jgi:hypothetical protein
MRLALLSLLLLSAPAFAAERPANLDTVISAFERTTGVDLHLAGDIKEPNKDIPNGFGPVDPAVAVKVIPVIEDVLMLYPTNIRGGLVKHMYLYGKLTMRGKPFMGAARPKMGGFDLAVRPRTTVASYKSTLHHELAHLIELNDRFPADQWVSLSSEYSGRLDQDSSSKSVPHEEWLAKGFVSRYGSKNRHEDFAEMAELAFTQPEKMKTFANTYRMVKPKLSLMTDVYQIAAPGMELPWTLGKGATYGSDGRPVRASDPVASNDDPPTTQPPAAEPPVAKPPPADPPAAKPPASDPPEAQPPVAQNDDADASGRRRGDGPIRLDDNGNPIR